MKLFTKFLAIALLAVAAFTSDSQAQSRDLGARRLELDNGSGLTITLETPAGGWVGNIPFIIPIPPPGNPSSGFTYAGTAASQILTWVSPNAVGPAPNNYAGGVQGSWQPVSTSFLNIVTGTGTNNTIPKWTGLNTQGNSLLTDDGTLLTYTGATGFNISGTTNMVAATVSSGLNITGGTLLMGGTSVLDQARNLYNITNISLAGSIGTATTITASGAITGGSFSTAGTMTATGAITGGSLTTAGAITGGSVSTGGTVTATGAITGGSISSAGAFSHTGAASPLSLNGSAGTAGAILTSAGAGATPTWTTMLSPANGGTGVNNGASTITLGGNFTTSGANAVTLTSTGATNVTLPTTGTLAVTSHPGIAVAWGVVSFNQGAGTAALVSGYNCSGVTMGGGPFFNITGVNTGGHATFSMLVSWYGGVGSDIGNASGLLAGWWSGGSSFSFADYTIGGGGAAVWPKNFVSFVIYGN